MFFGRRYRFVSPAAGSNMGWQIGVASSLPVFSSNLNEVDRESTSCSAPCEPVLLRWLVSLPSFEILMATILISLMNT